MEPSVRWSSRGTEAKTSQDGDSGGQQDEMSSDVSQRLNESSKSRGKRKALIPVVAPLKAECPVQSLIVAFLAGVNGKDSRGYFQI